MPLHFTPVKADPKLKALGIHEDVYFKNRRYADVSKDLIQMANDKDDASFFELMRVLSDDFFFFCYFVLDLPINHPFLVARCRDIQKKSHMCLDLWAREHWKSTLLTMAMTLFELKENPDERVAIFSHTRAMAKKHMRGIKQRLENPNSYLHHVWPNIFYAKPKKEAPKWSEDEGIYVKRKGDFPEASVEAWGLIDGLPTGSHFTVLVYDDIIDTKNINTTEQINKAFEMFQQSLFLTSRSGKVPGGKKRIIGTRYSMKDVYGSIIKQKKYEARIYPGEVDEEGKFKRGGFPVYKTAGELQIIYDENDDYIYSAQIGQNPVSEKQQNFKSWWVRYYKKTPYLNKYIVVDPANTKSKKSDWTVIVCIGVDARKNFFLVDMVRDKLGMSERWQALRTMVEKHGLNEAGYESYGMQSDIEYMGMQMEEEGFGFNIIPLGGALNKKDRIKRLIPLFQHSRFWIPRSIVYTDYEGKTHELIDDFINNEYSAFPFSTHDDMLDAMSRIFDMQVSYPNIAVEEKKDYFKGDPLDREEIYADNAWVL